MPTVAKPRLGCFGVAVRSVLAEARTKPGVYPAKAGHPRPRGVYSGSICNQTNGLKVIIYHSRRVPETGNSAGKESQVLCLALCYF